MRFNNFLKSFAAASVVILAATQCAQDKGAPNQGSNSSSVSSEAGQVYAGKLNIAYINIDSLLVGYNYAKDLNEALLRKQENARVSINEKGKVLEKEVADFQRKIKSNAFLSEERAQQEAMRIQQIEQNLNELSNRLNNELMVEQQKMNALLNDSVTNYLNEFNAVKNYDIIFSNTMGDNILIAKPEYDITTEVLIQLNKRYQPKK